MKRIEKLTDAQISRFPEFVRKWTDIGLCTDPADRPRAEAGIRKAYEIAGIAPPKFIVWCGSPLSSGLTRAIVMGLKNPEVETGDSVRASVGASVWDSVWDSVGDSVYGQHDAHWLGFYDYFRDACGMNEQTQRLVGLLEVSQSANWWLPHQNICWVSERHHVLNRDDRGRLHCETGPALSYPDGWSIWAINGVRLPESVVTAPEKQTVDQIRGEQNEEIKRIRIERFGWPKYLKSINAQRIDTRRNYIEGTKESLYRADGHCVLICACPSTARTYSLECPPNTETCRQAQEYLSSGLSSRIISAS